MKNETAILRVNLDVMDNEIKSSLRIVMAIESIQSLKQKYGKIIILSHRGRPEGYNKKLSLRKIAEALSSSGMDIKFVPSVLKDKIREETKDNGIYLLENMRFFEGEADNSPSFAKFLASLGDVFINDDFATAHRKSASNVGIVRYIKSSVPGNLLKAEIKNLSKLTAGTRHPFIVIIGGAKVADKLSVIKKFIPLADKILLGGGPGNASMMSQGVDIRDSVGAKESDLLKAVIKSKKIVAPIDFRVLGDKILDIGPNTEELFIEEIRKAKTVLWAGPMGMCELSKFSKGSNRIAKAIAESDAFSVAGGGETTDIIQKLGLYDSFSFVSTGGGAMLEFLSGKKLPAISALKINK